MDTLKKAFYLKPNSRESLFLYDHLKVEPFGNNQLHDGQNEPADVQQLFAIKEEVPWSSGLTEQDPDPLIMEEEKEELWTSQEGEQFHGQKETDINRFNVSVKSEEDLEEPQFSQLHQMKTKNNRETDPPACCLATETKPEPDEDYKGPEPGRKSSQIWDYQPYLDENASDNSDDDDDDDWNEVSSGSVSEKEDSDDDWKLKPVSKTAKIFFRCSVCDKQFIYKKSFHKHMMCHLEKDPSTSLVNECLRRNQISNLQKKGLAAEKRFPCSDCDKNFKFKYELKYHTMVHTGEKPFLCSDCGKKFRFKNKLKRHMMIHTGEKPFLCSDCDKRFRTKGMLQCHMMSHTKEKPFMCHDCEKTFRFRYELKYHMMSHTGEKPFICGDCGKTFRAKARLEYHMIIHTGEKPFECDQCGRTFKDNLQLQDHLKCHSTEK